MDGAQIGTVVLEEQGLSVLLADGSPAYFNSWWLRDNCPTSFDAETRERTFDIFHHATTPRPAAARVEGDVLIVDWAGEGHVSRYPLAMLAGYAAGAPRPDPADLPRRAWFADHYPNLTRVAHADLLESGGERRRWMEALLVEGVAIVTDMPDSDEALTRTAELAGTIRPSFFGAYFDVRTHVKPTNLAYTSKALELHTDVPAEELAPGIQYLHCRANSVTGGLNLFLDGMAVANDLREADPEAFRLLSRNRSALLARNSDDIDMTGAPAGGSDDLTGMARCRAVTLGQHTSRSIFDLPSGCSTMLLPRSVRFGRDVSGQEYVMAGSR